MDHDSIKRTLTTPTRRPPSVARTPKKRSEPPVPLPEGHVWRRAARQLTERLGVFPGDTVLVAAPATHDPTPALAARMPRLNWLQLVAGAFDRVDGPPTPGVETVQAPLFRPPLEEERLEAIVSVFAVPLLTDKQHERFVKAWAPVLAPYGKWLSLVALGSSNDPRLKQSEQHLKDNAFTRVRTNRLGSGGGTTTLAIMSARKE